MICKWDATDDFRAFVVANAIEDNGGTVVSIVWVPKTTQYDISHGFMVWGRVASREVIDDIIDKDER